ncbi:hypothetical protein QQ045_020841 [Rhodiola kirilowii]
MAPHGGALSRPIAEKERLIPEHASGYDGPEGRVLSDVREIAGSTGATKINAKGKEVQGKGYGE